MTSGRPTDYDLNMTNANAEFFDGGERAFSNDHEYAVPIDINLVGENLVWRRFISSTKPKGKMVTPKPETLNQFLRLADASGEEILRYARRWGVLNLCREDKLPSSHNPTCVPSESTNGSLSEPISEWRRIARMMQSIMNIASKLDDEKVASENDWGVLRNEGWLGNTQLLRDFDRSDKKYLDALKSQRRQISYVINKWVTISALQPTVTWDDKLIRLSFTGSPKGKLCGALVSQLLLTSGQSGLMSCSECRSWYKRTGKLPKRGQSNYCPVCKKKGIPMRNASRAYRARKKNTDECR